MQRCSRASRSCYIVGGACSAVYLMVFYSTRSSWFLVLPRIFHIRSARSCFINSFLSVCSGFPWEDWLGESQHLRAHPASPYWIHPSRYHGFGPVTSALTLRYPSVSSRHICYLAVAINRRYISLSVWRAIMNQHVCRWDCAVWCAVCTKNRPDNTLTPHAG